MRPGSLAISQSYSSDRTSTRAIAQQRHVYVDVDAFPSPTLPIEYISEDEESQLPDDQYYSRLARKRARANGNNFSSEMAQFPHANDDVVSDHNV